MSQHRENTFFLFHVAVIVSLRTVCIKTDEPPVEYKSNVIISATEGEEVELTCNVSEAFRQHPIGWRFEDEILLYKGNVTKQLRGRFKLGSAGDGYYILTIKPVTLADDGTFKCTENDGFGPGIHKTRLNVLPRSTVSPTLEPNLINASVTASFLFSVNQSSEHRQPETVSDIGESSEQQGKNWATSIAIASTTVTVIIAVVVLSIVCACSVHRLRLSRRSRSVDVGTLDEGQEINTSLCSDGTSTACSRQPVRHDSQQSIC